MYQFFLSCQDSLVQLREKIDALDPERDAFPHSVLMFGDRELDFCDTAGTGTYW